MRAELNPNFKPGVKLCSNHYTYHSEHRGYKHISKVLHKDKEGNLTLRSHTIGSETVKEVKLNEQV